MEVRCGQCNKLFRVSDDKITGAGIKFPCTRCGSYVRITHEDFEQYTRSHSAASIPDLFESVPNPVEASVAAVTAEPAAREAAAPKDEAPATDFAAQTIHEDVLEEKAPLFVEPDRLSPESAANNEPAAEIKPEPLMSSKPKEAPSVEFEPEPKPEPLFVPQQKAGLAQEQETRQEPDEPAPPVSSQSEVPVPPAVLHEEYTHFSASPAMEQTAMESIPSSTPSPSGKMFKVLIGTFIVLGLVGYGIFVQLQPSPQKAEQRTEEAAHETISNEGLQIVNPVGSIEAHGDLLLSGVIENATDKEKTAWYVVLEIYDAQGAVLSKIRLVNGNQIFSRRDYDILARRGENVQELKAKLLQGKGTVIPPKGKVSFEARYLQPPPGIASFIAQPLSFDPVQLQREIAEDAM